MKKIFIFLAGIYLFVLTAPVWFILLFIKRSDKKIIEAFAVFYDGIFNGFFVPIEKLMGVHEKPKPVVDERRFVGTAAEELKEGDVVCLDSATGMIKKVHLMKTQKRDA